MSISHINNALEFYGAAIYNTGDNLKVTNTVFENNNVIESPLFYPSDYWWERNEIHGGAIYNTGNSMRITNSTLKIIVQVIMVERYILLEKIQLSPTTSLKATKHNMVEQSTMKEMIQLFLIHHSPVTKHIQQVP